MAPLLSPYFPDMSTTNTPFGVNIAGTACAAGSVITATEKVKGATGTTFTQSVTSAQGRFKDVVSPPFPLP